MCNFVSTCKYFIIA